MSEILTGIRVIKFYAWESNFIKKILQLRYCHNNIVQAISLQLFETAKSGSVKHCTAIIDLVIVYSLCSKKHETEKPVLAS